MQLDLDTLITLGHSEAFNQLPLQLATQEVAGQGKWWQVQELLTEKAARLQIWEAAQYVALLFDTYGEQIRSVRFDARVEENRGDVWVNNTLRINDETCHDQECELGDEVLDAIEQIDEGRVLWAVVDAMNDIAAGQLLSKIGMLHNAFEEAIESGDEARKIATEHGKEVGVHIEAEILSTLTPQSGGKKPSARL